MKMKEKQNLTSGNITKNLVLFALPLLWANLLQSFYSIADMFVVGRTVGQSGLAAVSNASMICFIINSFCLGITMGGTVLIAQLKGAGDRKGQTETVGTLFLVTFIASFVITISGLIFCRPLFILLKVPAAAMQDACAYMKIICCGTIFIFGYHAVCSVMKGLGDSRSPLCFVTVAAAVNVILDLFLVSYLKIGTKGAAYATVFSQGISFVTAVIYLKRRNFVFDFKIRHFAVKADKLAVIMKIGLPAAGQMIIVNISYLLITGMLNNFGTAAAAASGVGLKINTFAGMPCWAVGQAVTAMAGQNIGADNIRRVKKTTLTGLRLNVTVTLLSILIVQIFAEPIIMLFDPSSPEVLESGILYLRMCCGANSLAYAVMYTFDSFAIGIGSSHIAMINALFDAVIVRLPLSWLFAFPLRLGFPGICLGQALSSLLPAIFGFCYFKSSKWERKTSATQQGKNK